MSSRKPLPPKREPRRWLLWCTLSDAPFEGTEYLTEQQLRDSLLLDLVEGVRSGKINLQLLPQRRKAPKAVEIAPKKGPEAPKNP
jgi:hypothetical protein